MNEPLPVDIFATIAGGLTIILIVYVVGGVICAMFGAGVASSRGRSEAGCAVLCFLLGPLGVLITMALPLSTAMRMQQERDWLRRHPLQEPPLGTPQPGPVATRPPPSATARRHRSRHGDPTTQFLARQPQTKQPSADEDAAQRSQGIADLTRRSQTEE